MIAGRQILFFEYDKNLNPALADDFTCLMSEYVGGRRQEFWTPTVDSVKVWNGFNGAVKHVYRNIFE